MKGAFHNNVKEKCHEPDMDDRGRSVFDVAERQQDVTSKFISAACVVSWNEKLSSGIRTVKRDRQMG